MNKAFLLALLPNIACLNACNDSASYGDIGDAVPSLFKPDFAANHFKSRCTSNQALTCELFFT